jgi:DNA-binding LacI/PurR family transcriptional regulator
MSKVAVTIQDVARVAGVSKSAVSAALTGNGRLADATKATILQVASEMGFEPNSNARRLRGKGVSHSVGLFTLDLDLSVGTRKIKVIRRLLMQQGYDVPIHSCNYQHEGDTQNTVREMRLLCQQRPRAIICNTTDLPAEVYSALEGYRAQGGVLVCYDRPVSVDCDQVVFDREDNTYQAVQHLLELGHRDIGFFEVSCVRPTAARVRGMARALAKFGLEPRPEWLYGCACYSEFEDDGVKMADYFLDLPHKPTAVCIVNDYAALAFISEVQRAGFRVPDDISVVGHDDRPIARYCNVPLTSVSHPINTIARCVVDLLLERLNGDCEASFRQHTVRGELVVRQSTCPLSS